MRRIWLVAATCLAAGLALDAAAGAEPPPSPPAPAEGEGAGSAAPVVERAGDDPVAEEEKPRFDLLDFQIDGNTVLDQEAVESAVYPHLGPDKTVDDVEQARAALESAYRKAGYVTVVVEIPEQDVDQGRVRLQVVEGSVEDLHISGSRYYALGRIREAVPALAEGQVPHMPTVQRQMDDLAKQSADRSVTPIFRAGSTPGKMEVELKVTDELPLHGGVEVNTRNTENTSLTRLIGSLRYDNLWQRFHSVSLQYQVSPEASDEVEVWSGTYVLPTGLADSRLALYGVGISSNTQLGANVGGTAVVGTGSIFGARLVKPMAATERFLHSATLGFDYKDFDQAINLAGQDTGRTPISYASFVAGYDATWRGEKRVSSLSLAAHFSVRGLGNDEQEFADKRATARPNYLFLTADLKHQQQLPEDFRLAGRASLQISEAPLISNEQFAAGGPLSVRGYHQTQQLGDHGVNLSLELHSPNLLAGVSDSVQNFRLLSFVDGAYLWILNPLPGTPSYYRMASAGLGLRMQVFKRLAGELDWSYPFYRQGLVDPGQQRVDFRLAYDF